MTSHSITLLKQKFDEIKKNINTIELKQREFFSHGVEIKPPDRTENFRHERPYRPASVSRFSETKPLDYDRNEELIRRVRELEIEKQSLMRKVEDKAKENDELKNLVKNQESKIRGLVLENENLRGRKENAGFQEKRPQSCMRDSKSPSKKNRVAFSKDLISVYPIDDNMPLVKATTQIPPAGRNLFVGSYSANHNPFQKNGLTDKHFTDDLHRYRRVGFD